MHQAWLRTRRYFWYAAGCFLLGGLCGAVLPLISRALAADTAGIVEKTLAPLAKRVYAADPAGRILLIWRHNLGTSAVMLLAGVIPVLPVMMVFMNGVSLGLLGVYWQLTGRLTIIQFSLGVLPHGLFELPAIFLAAAIGWRLSMSIWGWLLGGKSVTALKQVLLDAVPLAFLFIGLLGVAAVFEVLVSPMFLPIRAL